MKNLLKGIGNKIRSQANLLQWRLLQIYMKNPFRRADKNMDSIVQGLLPMIKISMASDRLMAKWSGLASMLLDANARLKTSGKSKEYRFLRGQIMRGELRWMSGWPPEKLNAAIVFLELHLAGIEIPKEKMRLLDLEEEEKGSLIQLARSAGLGP